LRFKKYLLENKFTAKEIIDKWNVVYKNYGSYPIPKNFQLFDKIKGSVKGTIDQLCYLNSLKKAKENPNIKLSVGVVFDKKVVERLLIGEKFINFSLHAWNIENNKVIDCTLGSSRNQIYLGVIVPETIVNKLEDGTDVRKYLFKLMGIK